MWFQPPSHRLSEGRGPPGDRSALLGQKPATHLKWMHHMEGLSLSQSRVSAVVSIGLARLRPCENRRRTARIPRPVTFFLPSLADADITCRALG